jgi:hypothetical protein
MERVRIVQGYEFEFIDQGSDDRFYQCRGDVYYDDEHDEIPEPGLWKAALELEQQLKDDGYVADANHSEKGWVEVTIL